MKLRLSTELSWHARGEAAFAWHVRTGELCEMSRDVVALCLAFSGGATVEEVAAQRPGGLEPERVREFAPVLQERLVLEAEGAPVELGRRRPYVPRWAVYHRRGDDVTVYGRSERVTLRKAARFLSLADGTRTLAELLPRPRWDELLALAHPSFAALKLLPPAPPATVTATAPRRVPAWAESTMPWPAIDPRAFVDGAATVRDPSAMAAYHDAIGDAEAQFDEVETTLSHLFRAPHPSLGGAPFGARLAEALVARGVPQAGARVVETGGGLGWVGRALKDALAPSSYLVVDRSPSLARAQRRRGLLSVVGDAMRLPLADGSVDLLVSNEMAGDLGTDEERGNWGALALVDEAARVLAPGGLAYVSEFGHPSDPPRKSDHLDHDEWSIRFEDLAARARGHGLTVELAPVPSLIRLDGGAPALATTRASYAALRALFRDHGADLPKRAWLTGELTAHAKAAGLALSDVHGVVPAPIGQRTMGLIPGEFWALLARRPRSP